MVSHIFSILHVFSTFVVFAKLCAFSWVLVFAHFLRFASEICKFLCIPCEFASSFVLLWRFQFFVFFSTCKLHILIFFTFFARIACFFKLLSISCVFPILSYVFFQFSDFLNFRSFCKNSSCPTDSCFGAPTVIPFGNLQISLHSLCICTIFLMFAAFCDFQAFPEK